MDAKTGEMSGGCPFHGSSEMRNLLGRTNRDWWPEALQLDILTVGGRSAIPYGEVFDYADGYVKIPSGPGLGIDVNEEYVKERAAVGHRWRNPIWRHADGSFAEW